MQDYLQRGVFPAPPPSTRSLSSLQFRDTLHTSSRFTLGRSYLSRANFVCASIRHCRTVVVHVYFKGKYRKSCYVVVRSVCSRILQVNRNICIYRLTTAPPPIASHDFDWQFSCVRFGREPHRPRLSRYIFDMFPSTAVCTGAFDNSGSSVSRALSGFTPEYLSSGFDSMCGISISAFSVAFLF